MAKHRKPDFKRQWWQTKRHLLHLIDSFRYWYREQVEELQDIRTELKEGNK